MLEKYNIKILLQKQNAHKYIDNLRINEYDIQYGILYTIRGENIGG
jgi:hypothetical protein